VSLLKADCRPLLSHVTTNFFTYKSAQLVVVPSVYSDKEQVAKNTAEQSHES